jgi:hypothetical protein
MERLTFNVGGPGFRHDVLEGRDHLVVPAVMLTEGVFNGSDGPIYYPKAVLAEDPGSWNHMPVVVYHPEENGKNVSARDQMVLNSQKIGLLLNTSFDPDGAKLKTEAWLDVERTNKIDPRIIDKLTANEKVEVSTGVFVPRKAKTGVFNSREYKQVARRLKPDHLAVLPDQVGACSVADGAGLLANKDKLTPIGNGLSLDERTSAVRCAISDMMSKPGYYWDGYVVDVYDSFAIYRSQDGLYKQDYSLDANGQVSLTGKPVAVSKVVQYRTADGSLVGNASGEFVSNLEVRIMDKKAKVDLLINTAGTVWVEADRTDLMSWSDERLDRLVKSLKTPPAPTGNATPPVVPAPVQTPAPTPAPEPVVANAGKPAEPAKQMTWDELVANANPTTRAMLSEMTAVYNGEKVKLIEVIVNAKGNLFTKDQLAAKEIPDLRAIAALIPQAAPAPTVPAPLFFGQATAAPVANAGIDIPTLEAPVIDYSTPAAN